MASNGNNNNLPSTPTDEVIKQCKESLATEVENYRSQRRAKAQERRTADKVEQYRICMYVKAKDTNTIYTNLKFCLTEGGLQGSHFAKGGSR